MMELMRLGELDMEARDNVKNLKDPRRKLASVKKSIDRVQKEIMRVEKELAKKEKRVPQEIELKYIPPPMPDAVDST